MEKTADREAFTETKNKLEFQIATWSSYKYHNTVEFLVYVFFQFSNNFFIVI